MKQRVFFTDQDKLHLSRLIKEKTGYFIKSNYVLSQAFRRRSFCVEQCGKSNEMFEFIGDQVLSYYVVKLIAQRCSSLNIEGDYSFRVRENQVTSIRQELVCNETLAKIIDEWGVAEYLIVGKSDEQNRVDLQTKVKADLFESIIGAIALDSEWDPNVLETVVSKALKFEEQIDSMIRTDSLSASIDIDNAVNKLKELAEKEICSQPKYDIAGSEHLGYNKNGNPIWNCECSIVNDKTRIHRSVWASSKNDAKKAAAYLVLCEHFQIPNRHGENSILPMWTYKDGKLMPYVMNDEQRL